jgi:GDP-mannose 6-dehydrogenase
MKVIIYGAGYVGCVTGACFARMGHLVVIIDVIQSKVESLRAGRSPILEPDLEDLIAEGVANGRLKAEMAVASGDAGLLEADVAVVCTGTPAQRNGLVDTRALRRVFQSIASGAARRVSPLTVIVRSTALAPMLREILAEAQPCQGANKLRLVVNPEFLRETTAISDFFNPPLLVVGGDDPTAVAHALSLFKGIQAPRHKVSLETASMLKYTCNAFHALKIAFANEIDTLAAMIGADGRDVMNLMVQDTILNISPAYLRPGFAFGGSCLPKDLRALEALARENHQPLPLLSSVLPSTRQRMEQALETILSRPARRLGFIGLSFKMGSDDLRDSPYVELVERLLGKGFEIAIYDSDLDPKRLVGANMAHVMERLPHLARILVNSPEEACVHAEAVVVCKRLLNLEALRALVPDGVVIYDLNRMVTSARPTGSPDGDIEPEHEKAFHG